MAATVNNRFDGHCMVVSGQWECSVDGEWKFVIDKNMLSRIVPLKQGIGLVDLEEAVLKEFGIELKKAQLSYWSPRSLEFTTGVRTPPVLVTSDVGVEYYLGMLLVNKGLNLFVKFEEGRKRGIESSSDEALGSGSRKRGSASDEAGFFQRCKNSGEYVEGEDIVGEASTAGSKTPIILTSQVDDELLAEVDEIEAKHNGGSKNQRGPVVSEVESWETDDGVAGEGEDSDEVVAPMGYDKDFWSNFLDDDYGGSNAVEVMCTTNDCFDHRVLVGDGVCKKKEKIGSDCGSEPNAGGIHTPVDQCTRPSGQANTGDQSNEDIHANNPRWTPLSGQECGVPRNDIFTGPGGSGQSGGRIGTQRYGVDGSAGDTFGGQRQTRKLEDVDDEEFDIPPLFDDTEYESEAIPDLDIDDDDKGIYVGKVFASKDDCQISLAIHAIKNMFYFKQTRTKRDYFVVTCPGERCDWRIMAHEMEHHGYYQIRKANLEHTCSVETRSMYMKKATSRVIAAVYKAKYGDPSKGPVPMDLQQLVLEDLRVSASYNKCWRAREKSVGELFGSEEDSFDKLEEYFHLLKIANPGTITHIETEVEEDGSERFLYSFLAFGASIEGFKKLRRVLVVDGTHLTGKYKGVLLTASAQDANFQVFPIAFAVVDSENDAAWTWFFEKLERIVADSNSLSILSDRHQSIYVAKKAVYPLAHHGACIVHLARNVAAKFHNKGLAKLVKNAGYAFTVGAFREIYAEIKSKKGECAKYLEKIGMAHWTRVYFPRKRYNLMTSNIAETLNKALCKGRGSPIVELYKFIRAMLTRWFSARRKKAGKHTGTVTPEVDKQLTKNMGKVKGSKVGNVSSWSYEVVGLFGAKHHVFLDLKQCNCKQYDKIKIPCGHALIAADTENIPYASLVDELYKTSTWVATYAGVINPEVDVNDVDIPEEITGRVLFPPRTRRPSGRPREKRIPSVGEYVKIGTGKVKLNRCSRCKGIGHNRTRCTVPI